HGGSGGVGGVEIVRGHGDLELREIAQKPAVGCDVPVAARLPELQARGTVRVMHARVDLHAVSGESLLGGAERVERDLALAEFQADRWESDLLEDEQIVVSEVAGLEVATHLVDSWV